MNVTIIRAGDSIDKVGRFLPKNLQLSSDVPLVVELGEGRANGTEEAVKSEFCCGFCRWMCSDRIDGLRWTLANQMVCQTMLSLMRDRSLPGEFVIWFHSVTHSFFSFTCIFPCTQFGRIVISFWLRDWKNEWNFLSYTCRYTCTSYISSSSRRRYFKNVVPLLLTLLL